MNQILISHYSPWSATETKELKSLAAAQMPVGAIANKLGRTPPAIRAKARLERIALFDDHGIQPPSLRRTRLPS